MKETTYIFKCPHCGTINSTDKVEKDNDNFVPTIGVFCLNNDCSRSFTVKFTNNFKDFSVEKMSTLDLLHNLASAYDIQRSAAKVGDFFTVMHQEQATRQLMREANIILQEAGRLEIIKE